MKTLSFFLLFVLLTFGATHLYSQNNKLYVGAFSLEEIEGPWVTLQLHYRYKATNVLIFYGQSCVKDIGLAYNLDELRSCIALRKSSGELVEVGHYTEALNLMERNGFTLRVMSVKNEFEDNSARFIFSKGPHDDIFIDRSDN